ncbi:MAG: GAF domain-containing protein [Anaerolineae bacterium]|nr:GAF domain-containing protein [Anaerolineae bacterium]
MDKVHTLLSTKTPGVLCLDDTRIAILNIETGFWELRDQLESWIGRQMTQTILQQTGIRGGLALANVLLESVPQGTPDQALQICLDSYQAMGSGQFKVIESQWPLGYVKIAATDAFEAWAAQQKNYTHTEPLCAYTSGTLLGFVKAISGVEALHCIEHSCQALGAETCIFEIRTGDKTETRILPPADNPAQLLDSITVSATARVLAHQALEQTFDTLRKREERLALAMQATNDGIWDWDIANNSVYFSSRWKAMLGYQKYELEDRFETWLERMHPDDIETATAALRGYLCGESPQFEVEHRLRHKDGSYRWILTRGMLIKDENGASYQTPLGITTANRVIGSHTDITARKRSEEAIRELMGLQRLITTISTNFINLSPDEVDDGINKALATIGEFTNVDRSYVFLYSDDKTLMNCTHEWCAPQIEAHIHRLKDMPTEDLSWSNAKILNGETLHIPSVSNLPAEAAAEKEEFRFQGTQSLMVVPMVYQGSVIGFLGFDAVRAAKNWSEQARMLLQSVSDVFVNALEHKRAQTIQAGQQQFLELLATGGASTETLKALIRIIEEQSPGMLGLILLLDEDGKHLHYGAAVRLPEEYALSVEGLEIGPLVGSCGTACYLKQRVIVENIETDPRWAGLRDLALKYNLRACWSEPVLSSTGEVIGTFAMYYQYPRYPTEAELHTIEVAAHLAGVAIEHKQSQDELRRANLLLEQRVIERTREIERRRQAAEGLKEILTYLNSSRPRDEILDYIAMQACRLMNADASVIHHIDTRRAKATIEASCGISPEEPKPETKIYNGYAHRAISQRRPYSIPDIEAYIAILETPESAALDADEREWRGAMAEDGPQFKALLTVPLSVNNQIYGDLTFYYTTKQDFTEESIQLGVTLGNQASLAIENTRLYTQVQRRADEGQTLLNVQRAITSDLSLDGVLQMIAEEAKRLTGVKRAIVLLVDENKEKLIVRVVAGEDRPDLLGQWLSVEGSVSGRSMLEGKPVLITDMKADPRADAETAAKTRFRSQISVPLISPSGPLGIITVSDPAPRKLNTDDVRVLTMLASSAVIGLENARLYEEEQMRHEESEKRRRIAEGLQDILAVLNSSSAFDEILDYTVYQASQLLGADAGVIYRAHEHQQTITIEGTSRAPGELMELGPLGNYMEGVNRSLIRRQPYAVGNLTTEITTDLPQSVDSLDSSLVEWKRIIRKYYRAYMAIPLIIKDDLYGALVLYYREEQKFTEEDISLGMALGGQVAMAIENARLREQAEEIAVATERNRLARDLHDAVSQTLFSASIIADVLPRIWDRDEEEARRRLNELRELTRGALAEMRMLLVELRPSALVEAEFPELLRQLTEAFIGKTRIPVTLTINGDCDFPADIKVTLYRIAQEALNNIAKHASATEVCVCLDCQPEQIKLHILDNGRGFSPQDIPPNHFGLNIMQERAGNIDATLTVASQVGEGTQIVFIWPNKAGGDNDSSIRTH